MRRANAIAGQKAEKGFLVTSGQVGGTPILGVYKFKGLSLYRDGETGFVLVSIAEGEIWTCFHSDAPNPRQLPFDVKFYEPVQGAGDFMALKRAVRREDFMMQIVDESEELGVFDDQVTLHQLIPVLLAQMNVPNDYVPSILDDFTRKILVD